MNFLEFAVWGAYLTSLGRYLASAGLAEQIGWFYTVQGIVSIFMPALVGIVADRWVPAQRMLSLCHGIAGIFMLAATCYCASAQSVGFAPLFTLYSLSVAFFMPTIGLANSVAYTALGKYNLDTVKHFPPIRIFGTIGFIAAMLFVNYMEVDGERLQGTFWQLGVSGALSLVMMCYALTMPGCPVNRNAKRGSLVETLGLNAFKLFKQRRMAVFFIFSMLLGVSLQITNGYANPYISSFGEIDIFKGAWGVENANALISLSQMSETLCILLIPFCLKRFGIKGVMLMSMFAWVLRFGLFGIGDPGSGLTFLLLSMIVYGIAFDFFNVSGSLYVDRETDPGIRSSAQGLFMIMTNGIGATVGTLGAQAIVNANVFSQPAGMAQLDGWRHCWFIFAGYALVVGVLFIFIFHDRKDTVTESVVTAVEVDTVADPEGMIAE